MFRKPTVFVLGAGVSQPFGFPSGRQLIRELCGTNQGYQNQLKQMLHFAVPKSRAKIEPFFEHVSRTPIYSIDKWLESNNSFIELGKCAIAYAISSAERQVPAVPSDLSGGESVDWFTWLWNNLVTGKIADLKNNRVWFITFNYDRLLEYRLELAVNSSYVDATAEERRQAVDDLHSRIVHIHGALAGGLRGIDDFGNTRSVMEIIGDGGQISKNASAVATYAEGISIISEDIEKSGVLDKAHYVLKKAERAVFLGFGYEARNVERLNPVTHVQGARPFPTTFRETAFSGAALMGSAMGLEDAEISNASRQFADFIKLDTTGCDAVRFCRKYIVL